MYAVIMAGGSGTRFWPLSRETMPKQLLKIGGEDTLIRETVGRILPLVRIEDVYIVSNHALADTIGRQLGSRFEHAWQKNLILEPEAKNTAPALGLAALHLERLDPDSIMIVLAADHSIRKSDAFLDILKKAAEAAKQDYLVTLGIKPDRPETGYGYIKAGDTLQGPGIDGVHRVEAFVEKPAIETAREYLKQGSYYWNSGIFIWKTRTLLQEIEKHAPALSQGLQEIRASIGTENESDVIHRVFKNLESISIDYAVMEKTDKAVVVPLDAGWNDVGSWSALWEVLPKDDAGNAVSGDVSVHEAANSLIFAGSRLVAVIGINDCVVVETSDAVLVSRRDQAQKVKQVVDHLKREKRDEALLHRRVNRPWGAYECIDSSERFQVKRITVNPGASLSLQKHMHRAEHWIVVKGTARITRDRKVVTLSENQSTYIPLGVTHRLENPGRIPLELIEVQSGSYLGEDDIIRLDDHYGRSGRRGEKRPTGKK